MDLNNNDAIQVDDLRKAAEAFDDLAFAEYGIGIVAILTDATKDIRYRISRVARLTGIILREPYSEAHEQDEPAQSPTDAKRYWSLNPVSFLDPATRSTWQFQALESLSSEMADGNAVRFAREAHEELGFFNAIAASVRRHICGNQDQMDKVETLIAEVQPTGGPSQLSISSISDLMTATSGTTLAVYLVHSIPWLTPAMAPVVVGVVLILMVGGLRVFCHSEIMDGARLER